MSLSEQLRPALSQRRQNHLYRSRATIDSAQGPWVEIDGRRLANFCSNDYLGLANHPALVAAFQQAANDYGVGSGASHLVCGHSRWHQRLEEALAELTGRSRALLYSTGYMANLGVITALLNKGDQIFEDKLNHASLLDAGLLSGARFQRFLHNDVAQLSARLARRPQGRRLIAVDGVFSMDGDLAPLPALSALAAAEQAWLMVDDAHGLGVLGRDGAGCAQHFGLDQEQLPILMGTLGKALGCFGAFIAGSEELIETLIQFSRSYIYTTALPPAVAAAALAAVGLLSSESWRREQLQNWIGRFRDGARQLDLPLMDSITAVQPILIGDSERALLLSEQLRGRGFLISAIRPPTVPVATARLRVTLSAGHSAEQIDQLLDALAEVLR